VKLLVDENLPPRLASGLDALFKGEHHVEYVVAKFGRRGVTDEEWMAVLGREGGWCVLSGDRRIATKRVQRTIFDGAGLTGFFPASAVLDLRLERMASRILFMWPQMVTTAKTVAGGCYQIGPKGDRLKSL
jgi:hypothetical protein